MTDRQQSLQNDLSPTVEDLEMLTLRPVANASNHDVGAGAQVARLDGFDGDGQPLISNINGLTTGSLAARTTVELSTEHIGRNVVVVFEAADVHRPIVVGALRDNARALRSDRDPEGALAVQVDEERLVLVANREIVLKCGDASITLTKAGKVLIQGTYVSTRSSGVNRIKGGSVQIN